MTAAGQLQRRFLTAGDTALVVEFGDRIDRDLALRVVALSQRLGGGGIPGVVEVVPTFRSLMVHYDPLKISGSELEGRVDALLAESASEKPLTRRWTIPICYHATVAPDLMEVAQRTGLGPEEVAERHSVTDYFVYMVGFLPGYPYLGDLVPELVLPRRENPRVKVPPGSVAIARTLTAIYTLENPGGWHLIGRTPVRLFDARRTEPARLATGDAVRFEPVPLKDYERLAKAIAAGRHQIEPDAEAA